MKDFNKHTLQQGYLDVGDNHSLYYETYGNPNGINVVFLHGGPGSGFSDFDKRFFDPEKFHVVLFDQRGSGRSKPLRSIENNTTQKLSNDINTLMNHFGFEKTILFGGSWGSALALVYAIQNPEKVIGLVLRGIFLANKESIDYYTDGSIKKFFPEAWERFKNNVPENQRSQILDYYLNNMLSENSELRNKFCYEWQFYGGSIAKKSITKQEVEEMLTDGDIETSALFEAFYSKENCFLPDNYILNNVDKIKGIPISIVQGRYDMICPPIHAYQLYQKLNNAKLFMEEAGHIASEPEIEKRLIEQINKFA